MHEHYFMLMGPKLARTSSLIIFINRKISLGQCLKKKGSLILQLIITKLTDFFPSKANQEVLLLKWKSNNIILKGGDWNIPLFCMVDLNFSLLNRQKLVLNLFPLICFRNVFYTILGTSNTWPVTIHALGKLYFLRENTSSCHKLQDTLLAKDSYFKRSKCLDKERRKSRKWSRKWTHLPRSPRTTSNPLWQLP